MFLDLNRKSVNTTLLYFHLGLQIIAGYWAVYIDGYKCLEQFVLNVTYFAYALLLLNFLLYSLMHTR